MKKLFIIPALICAVNVYADYQTDSSTNYSQWNNNQGSYNKPQYNSQDNYQNQNNSMKNYNQQPGTSQKYYSQQPYSNSSQNNYNQNQYETGQNYQQSGYNLTSQNDPNYNQQNRSTVDSNRSYNDNRSGKPVDFSSADKYPNDTYATESDHEINARIRKKFSGWISDKYKYIILRTNNGIVVIEGYVDSDNEKNKLADEIITVEGVRSAQNNAQVKK